MSETTLTLTKKQFFSLRISADCAQAYYYMVSDTLRIQSNLGQSQSHWL